jgi:hypothetical protein
LDFFSCVYQLKVDILRLESSVETQHLASLVEGTRALDYNETIEQRERAIFLRNKTDLENVRHLLDNSVTYRTELGNYLYQLLSSIQELKISNKKENEHHLATIQDHLKLFRSSMLEIIESKKESYSGIMKEYLIARHNGNMIQEIIVNNQNACISHRNYLNTQLRKMIEIAKDKHEKLEVDNSSEITLLTSDLRSQIMEKERIVEELDVSVRFLRKEKLTSYQSVLNDIASYDEKYLNLEKRRKEEVNEIHFELNYLKRTIKHLEETLFYGGEEEKEVPEVRKQQNQKRKGMKGSQNRSNQFQSQSRGLGRDSTHHSPDNIVDNHSPNTSNDSLSLSP